MMANKNSNLVYFFSETHYFAKDFSILNVTLVGPLISKNLGIFETCVQEIIKLSSKCIIFNFRDVPPELDPNFLPIIESLMGHVRERPVQIRFSGLHPDIRRNFLEKKLVQEEEMTNNLADALNSIPTLEFGLKKVG